MTTKKLIGRECKFAVHVPTRSKDIPDVHYIKERLHYDDGSTEANFRPLKNFPRPLWITKPNKRNHTQKKECEQLDNLLKKEVTQSDLRNEVAKLLDRSWSQDTMKKLAASPYLYGTDISSTSILKHMYKQKFPNLNSQYSVAAFDIETDVINGTDDVIIATIAMQGKVFTAVDKKYIFGISMVDQTFMSKMKLYIGEYLAKFNIEAELYIADDPVDLIRAVFAKAHEWQPDFLAIWNMDYDIPQVLKILEKYKVDPRDILCDSRVPRELRICKYRQGTKKKVTASGKVQPISPAAQWHTLVCTSSFYVIDAMCTYKHLRLGKQEEPSYSLDAILDKELGIRKLKFKEADHIPSNSLAWHRFMQTYYKIEYMVYNVFDCISMLELDEKTKDLGFTLASFSDTSDFSNFKSQPKRIADALHWFFLERGIVIGTVFADYDNNNSDVEISDGSDENEEEDNNTLSLKDWIVTLPAHLTVLGMNCILEDYLMRTGIRCFVFDSDELKNCVPLVRNGYRITSLIAGTSR